MLLLFELFVTLDFQLKFPSEMCRNKHSWKPASLNNITTKKMRIRIVIFTIVFRFRYQVAGLRSGAVQKFLSSHIRTVAGGGGRHRLRHHQSRLRQNRGQEESQAEKIWHRRARLGLHPSRVRQKTGWTFRHGLADPIRQAVPEPPGALLRKQQAGVDVHGPDRGDQHGPDSSEKRAVYRSEDARRRQSGSYQSG